MLVRAPLRRHTDHASPAIALAQQMPAVELAEGSACRSAPPNVQNGSEIPVSSMLRMSRNACPNSSLVPGGRATFLFTSIRVSGTYKRREPKSGWATFVMGA